MTSDIAFVACIERNAIEAQAFALFESIRTFGGRFAGCPIYAVAPRQGYGVGVRARRRLRDLAVEYVDDLLNRECREYGSANRVLAAAHVEANTSHEILAVLDSDTVFLREPVELELPAGVDLAVRPVDVKGICTTGTQDPNEVYWTALARLAGCDVGVLPWIETFVEGVPVRANYNGGLVVARSGKGILRRWADIFMASIRAGLTPSSEVFPLRSSTGPVGPAACRLWGSNQAALALAAWSTTDRVQILAPEYNYPLHVHQRIPPARRASDFSALVHVHYHWLGAADTDAVDVNPLFAGLWPHADPVRLWLESRFPLRHASGR